MQDPVSEQFNQFLNDQQHVLTLAKIKGNNRTFPERCTKCLHPHNIYGTHNLVQQSYSELQFLSDLIGEQDTLYQICEWARNCIEPNNSDRQSVEENAWNHIISGKVEQAYQILGNSKQQSILISLRPWGDQGERTLDFMRAGEGNENWVLTLKALNECEDNGLLLNWALCKSSDDWTNYYVENWLKLRAALFSQIMHRRNQLYHSVRPTINFGINKPYTWAPQEVQLLSPNMIYNIQSMGKAMQQDIIQLLVNGRSNILPTIVAFIEELKNIEFEQRHAEARSKCLQQLCETLIELKWNHNLECIDEFKMIIVELEQEHADLRLLLGLLQKCWDIRYVQQKIAQLVQIRGKYVIDSMAELGYKGEDIEMAYKPVMDQLPPKELVEYIQRHSQNKDEDNKYCLDMFMMNYNKNMKMKQCLEAINIILENQVVPEERYIVEAYSNPTLDNVLRALQQMPQKYSNKWVDKLWKRLLKQHLNKEQLNQVINHIPINDRLLSLLAIQMSKHDNFMKYLLN